MGFDLTGKEPKQKVGEYFRNNCWYWRPLWEFVEKTCSDIITPEEVKSGHYNDGMLITSSKAIAIAKRLREAVENGEALQYKQDREKFLESLPDEDCFCVEKKLETATCKACNGTGKREAWAKSYPFTVENVTEFATFCANSGGFEIW